NKNINKMATCSAITEKGKNCKAKCRKYGVCGRHLAKAWDGSNIKNFNDFIDEYTALTLEYKELTDYLENQNINILSIQGSFNNNLTQNQVFPLANPQLQRVAELLMHKRNCILRYQKILANTDNIHENKE